MTPDERRRELLAHARRARGFMPDDEGLALSRLAAIVASDGELPALVVEIGAYCGRSGLYLAAGLAGTGPVPSRPPAVVFSVDHHHGSEENQLGWEHHEPDLADEVTGRLETLSAWRTTIVGAGAEDLVIGVVGDSPSVAAHLSSPVGLLFIDGGHGEEPAWADYRSWSPRVALGGYLAIHDVFADPKEGGRPPYEIYCEALSSKLFSEEERLGCNSLRVLRRTG